MRVGVVFPQTEIGTDPMAVRDYAQAAESLGYDHLVAFDHVLGANTASRPGWSGAYQHTDAFYEPFVLFGYLAGITKSMELVTGIVIIPQRQTALVAKQAAAPGHRHRMERRRVRSPGRELPQPGPSVRGADRGDAGPMDPGAGHLRRAVAQDHRRGNQSPTCPASDPHLVRRKGGPGAAENRSPRRRMVPPCSGPTTATAP